MTPFQIVNHTLQLRAALAQLAQLAANKHAICGEIEGGFEHVRAQIQNADIICSLIQREWERYPIQAQEITPGMIGTPVRNDPPAQEIAAEPLPSAEPVNPAPRMFAQAGEVVGCSNGHGFGTLTRDIFEGEELKRSDIEPFAGPATPANFLCPQCTQPWGANRKGGKPGVSLHIAGEGWRHPID